MRRPVLVAWILLMSLVLAALLALWVASVVTAAVLVDEVPGADAGLATSAALDDARRTMGWAAIGAAVAALVGAAVPAASRWRRR